MLVIIILIIGFLAFITLSGAIVYHLHRFSPNKKNGLILIFIYIIVSLILVTFATQDFLGIEWKKML